MSSWTKDGSLRFRPTATDARCSVAQLEPHRQDLAQGSAREHAGADQRRQDGLLSYDSVMKAMSVLQRAGVARASQAVKSGG